MGFLFSELLGDSRDFFERLRTSKPDGLLFGSTASRICSPRICCLWTKRIAELSQGERSEASPSEARVRAKRGTVRRAKRDPPPPKAAAPAEGGAAEGGRALRATRKRKLEATKLEANKHGMNQRPGSAGKRALHVRDIENDEEM